MNTRAMIWIGMFVGSALFGLIPMIWGGAMLSLAGLVLSTIGAFVGIWLGYKASTSL